jgi:uncharacterized membrane protein
LKKSKNLYSSLSTLINGILMGTANKVPGVSGGLVAIAIGFYEELVFSLKKIDRRAFKFLFSGKLTRFYNHINGQFLILILLGIVISYFSTSKLLDFLLERYEIYVWSLFFGLVIGTVYHLKNKIYSWTRESIIILLLGIIIGIGISIMNPASENDNLIFVFVCGIISVSGMILPGLSGSFILILMGNYVLLLVDSVNALYDSIFEMINGDYSFVDNIDRINKLKIISVFAAGSMAGLILLSNILSFFLRKYDQLCYSIIIGFILGSLGVIWPWKNNIVESGKIERYIPELNQETFIGILFILIGIIFVIILSKYDKSNN